MTHPLRNATVRPSGVNDETASFVSGFAQCCGEHYAASCGGDDWGNGGDDEGGERAVARMNRVATLTPAGALTVVYVGNILTPMAILPDYFPDLEGFQWDPGNREKNWHGHEVATGEIEQAFFNRPVIVAPDPKHSRIEPRHFLLGRSNEGRALTITFTIRGRLIRPITARPMSRGERRIYAERKAVEEKDA